MLEAQKIDVGRLSVGMFVSKLDRPWLDTPFLTQGFLLESKEDIEKVERFCDFVYIDTNKSRHLLGKGRIAVSSVTVNKDRARVPIETIFAGRPIETYVDQAPWREEHSRANVALDHLLEDITEIFDHVSDSGKLDVIRLKSSVDPIVASMSSNPDACMWLGRMKRHDRYTYQHSLSVSIWAVALGRQLGLHKRDLRSLAVGGMLMDIGKLRIDPKLLQAERALTEEETQQMQSHVHQGVEMVKESGIINQDILDMVECHHERYDGSGYPYGLGGDKIPPFARIAALADTYDAMTSVRSYAQALSPSDAVRNLYQERDHKFQAEFVEAFIQAVGIYPAGTVVELSSGEVAIVVAEYRMRRLLPKVILVLDKRKNRYPKPRLVDLLTTATGEDSSPITISKALEPGAYDIDISRYKLN